ncbi:glycosyltransferase family 2 protein [Cesiribacter andamanensis]|uniref:dTDP-Rha:alpha-D-GlcNAc-pyrophosphate polyprenol, alpha-3-L-rhamnosyltransferase n=1 Tax=Cesiribacter andamanensis AMV16 TaxID=1279009 RepID=M7N911_9BACT|nr:glycosyltransferase family 2 protein [Cesiribacter andamanensis]EMR03696.1 dTDP-Rha:alpha-D-GlcNAc-pyrophosphate polyprenol, alpha-3-L-rhamnosyltransferase [Cesiribacter andamanensis AMV16]
MSIAISIIVVNYNTYKLTSACIYSILEHTKGVDYEVVLVDNNSTECEPEQFLLDFPSVRLIKTKANLGFAKGNNLGIKYAKGEVILLVNSDAELTNNAVKILADYLTAHTDVGVVTGKLRYPDGRLQHNCQRFPNWKVSLFELLRLQKVFRRWGQRCLLGPFFSYDRLQEVDWVWGTVFMFRKSDLENFPNQQLPDDFFMYGEDIQWCMEFRKRNRKVVFVPQAEILHHMGGSSANSKKLILQNTDLFLQKYYHPLHLRVLRVLNSLL